MALGAYSLLAGKIGLQGLQSFVQGRQASKQAKAQHSLQLAQAYRQQSSAYAQLTEQLKRQEDYNEAVTEANRYNFANTLSNAGALKFRDAQLRGVMARSKVQLRTKGLKSASEAVNQMASMGTVGASTRAVANDIDKQIAEGMSQLSEQRRNQVYNLNSKQVAMWTNFQQSKKKLDTSRIDPSNIPQNVVDIDFSSGNAGKLLPHLISSGISNMADVAQRMAMEGVFGGDNGK